MNYYYIQHENGEYLTINEAGTSWKRAPVGLATFESKKLAEEHMIRTSMSDRCKIIPLNAEADACPVDDETMYRVQNLISMRDKLLMHPTQEMISYVMDALKSQNDQSTTYLREKNRVDAVRQQADAIKRTVQNIADELRLYLQRLVNNHSNSTIIDKITMDYYRANKDNRIAAIKKYRELTGVGLKEAKDHVDKLTGFVLNHPHGMCH